MKKNKYGHCATVERQQIEFYLDKGKSHREIALLLGRNRRSIDKEVKVNSVNGVYDWRKADIKARLRRKRSKYQGMKIVESKGLWDYVVSRLQEDWSPEEISGRLKHKEKSLPYVSHKGIYTFVRSVYGRQVEKFLRYEQIRKNRKSQKVSSLTDRVFIDKRPKSIEKRKKFGHWEADFIVSGKNGSGALLVFVERKTRYVLIYKLEDRKVVTINQILGQIVGAQLVVNTLTIDNDVCFRHHKEMSHILSSPIYFCHPYHSWEKGSVENMNKWIRQYVKKSSDLSSYTREYIQFVEDRLNDRPRKCLSYQTPREAFHKHMRLRKEVSVRIKSLQNKKHRLLVWVT